MAGPYDCVVSIGGQSFVDGIWRLLGPALEGLTNPLPLALPGFTNATMRVTQIVPVFPSPPPNNFGLNILARIEVTAEALLHITNAAEGFRIALGAQDMSIAGLTGAIDLPEQNGALSNILVGGGGLNLGPGTGAVRLPPVTGSLSGGSATGTLALPDQLEVPALPFPAIIPVAVDLTPSAPFVPRAAIQLAVLGPSGQTRFGLLFLVLNAFVAPLPLVDSTVVATVRSKLKEAADQIVAGLSLPSNIVQPAILETDVESLLKPVPRLVAAAFDDALTLLLAETGRITYPLPGPGSSSDVMALPFMGDARLTLVPNGSYLLQAGFRRQAPGGDVPDFPAFSGGAIDTEVRVGNIFLLNLLGYLVEKLPAFAFPFPALPGSTDANDINGNPHRQCFNFRSVTLTLGPVAVGGGEGDGISVCIDGNDNAEKTFSLIGHFSQGIPNFVPVLSNFFNTLATVAIDFTLPIRFDLDGLAAISNLRLSGVPSATARVVLSRALILGIFGAVLALAALGVLGLLFGGTTILVVGAAVLLLLYLASNVASFLLENAVRTVLAGAASVRSPVALSPGIFEAFGSFSPLSVVVDALTAKGVLQTPTTPWALLPRIGLPRPRGSGTGLNPDTAPIPSPPPSPGHEGRKRARPGKTGTVGGK
jgi:hypothetical protein